jgi:hypothetical protein
MVEHGFSSDCSLVVFFYRTALSVDRKFESGKKRAASKHYEMLLTLWFSSNSGYEDI